MKILLIGSFDFDKLDTGGQPVKSRELFWALAEKYGKESISYLETPRWKHHPITTFFKTLSLSKKSDIIIMLPAHNGVKVFSRILAFVKRRYSKKIYYDVIGGWLNEMLDNKPRLIKSLQKFDCVFVETESMKLGLDEKGIRCKVVPNFKRLEPISISDKPLVSKPPFNLCIFSRITEMKGIGEAIETIRLVNELEPLYTLDIYGPIDESYKEKFFKIVDYSKDFVNYKGCASPNESVAVLKDYFALLFPTKFYTEGVPGTIIDAYFSGVPVISSKWLNFHDVIIEGKTGFGFTFGEFTELKDLLIKIANEPSLINEMRTNCLNISSKYTPASAIGILEQEFCQ